MRLNALKDTYRNPHVWHGLQLTFTLRQKAGQSRKIAVANQFVEELAPPSEAMDVLLPSQFPTHHREW